MSLEELFYGVDNFCLEQNQKTSSFKQLGQTREKPGPKSGLCPSEIMTIIIHFHQSDYRTFKGYYTKYVLKHLHSEFPGLVSYSRFVELMPSVTILLCLYLNTHLGVSRGISFVDATPIPVCHNKRISRHKVFRKFAKRGKSTMGYFYGFKLHLIVNDRGELLSYCLTPGNVDDRVPVPQMTKNLYGKLFGDKGYISQALFEELFERGLKLITPIRKNMKNHLMPLEDKLGVRKRSIIETINDQLKNVSQVSHTRHRSPLNFFINLISGLIAYCLQPKKPALKLSQQELAQLPLLI